MGVDKNKQVLMETDGRQWKQLRRCVSDVFRCVQMCSDVFRCVQMCSDGLADGR